MSDFLTRTKAAAKANKKRIVLSEGEDQRVLDAARQIVDEDIADLIIVGDHTQINVPGATVVDPLTSDKTEAYAQKFAELRAKKGITIEQAREQMKDYTYYAAMMVRMGDADGMVSGACHSTANTLRTTLQCIKTAPDAKIVSAFVVECVPDCEYGDEGNFIFSDVALNINPSAEEVAEIAIQSARSWEMIMGSEARVALLSYSTAGSAGGVSAEKSREAIKIVHEKAPEISADGEMQLDAALIPHVASRKIPGSSVAGKANVLVFPDLEAGNIGYKMAERIGKAKAFGPVLQGIARPVSDLSRGCSADDIVGTVAIVAVQAQHMA